MENSRDYYENEPTVSAIAEELGRQAMNYLAHIHESNIVFQERLWDDMGLMNERPQPHTVMALLISLDTQGVLPFPWDEISNEIKETVVLEYVASGRASQAFMLDAKRHGYID